MLIDGPEDLLRLAILLDNAHTQLVRLGYNLAKRLLKYRGLYRAADLDRFGDTHNCAWRNFLAEPQTALCSGQWKHTIPALIHHTFSPLEFRRAGSPSYYQRAHTDSKRSGR
jgi:hypothetical protein